MSMGRRKSNTSKKIESNSKTTENTTKQLGEPRNSTITVAL
jgi:hypothetical protein